MSLRVILCGPTCWDCRFGECPTPSVPHPAFSTSDEPHIANPPPCSCCGGPS